MAIQVQAALLPIPCLPTSALTATRVHLPFQDLFQGTLIMELTSRGSYKIEPVDAEENGDSDRKGDGEGDFRGRDGESSGEESEGHENQNDASGNGAPGDDNAGVEQNEEDDNDKEDGNEDNEEEGDDGADPDKEEEEVDEDDEDEEDDEEEKIQPLKKRKK